MGAVFSLLVSIYQQGSLLVRTYFKAPYDGIEHCDVHPLLVKLLAVSIVVTMHSLYKGRKKQPSYSQDLSNDMVLNNQSAQAEESKNQAPLPDGRKIEKMIESSPLIGTNAQSFQDDLLSALSLEPTSMREANPASDMHCTVSVAGNAFHPTVKSSPPAVLVNNDHAMAETSLTESKDEEFHSDNPLIEEVERAYVKDNPASLEVGEASARNHGRRKKSNKALHRNEIGDFASWYAKGGGLDKVANLAKSEGTPLEVVTPGVPGRGKAADHLPNSAANNNVIGARKPVQSASRQRSSTLTKALRGDQSTHELLDTSHDDPALEQLKDENARREDFVAYQNDKLRKQLGVQIDVYQPGDKRPRHPNHHRTWYSKNLWCTKCHGRCQNCKAWCCKYQEAYAIAYGNTTTVEEKDEAHRIIELIRMYNPTGTDNPTFLRCTTESCRKLVCPECCGICPNQLLCQDLQCVRCKADPWVECDWHMDL